ncbi:MAG: dipeptidase PepV [Ruminococcus sp.]|jgi:succinyl-diaminopimelate desuccinylase
MDLKDEMIHRLKELIAIPSYLTAPKENAPFGAAIDDALLYLLEIGTRDGFSIKNTDHYGGHIEFPGQTDEIVAVSAHLDVVPPGDLSKWTVPPFSPEVKDGRLYGRGALDDKGPLIAAYYAMKRLKESGFRPRRTIRLILGCDEETDGLGMNYYLEHENAPCLGFTPDGDFPVIHGEMGLLFCEIHAKMQPDSSSVRLIEFQGGAAPNMVPDTARFTLECQNQKEALSQRLERFLSFHPEYDLQHSWHNTKLQIIIRGKSAHGSAPENGINAVSLACALLENMLWEPSPLKNFLTFYNSRLGFDFHGERLGKVFSDSVSGPLIVNPGVISLKEGRLSLILNLRYPVTVSSADIMETLNQAVCSFGLSLTLLEDQPPLYFKREDPLIRTLLNVYQQHTQDKTSVPLISAGATYARAIPNTAAFGAIFPGDPDLCHQADEYIAVDRLMLASAIYEDALRRLAAHL